MVLLDPDVVITDDDDFDPEPEYASSKKGTKAKGVKLVLGKGKGKSVKKEEKEITFRDERKLPPPPPTLVSLHNHNHVSDYHLPDVDYQPQTLFPTLSLSFAMVHTPPEGRVAQSNALAHTPQAVRPRRLVHA